MSLGGGEGKEGRGSHHPVTCQPATKQPMAGFRPLPLGLAKFGPSSWALPCHERGFAGAHGNGGEASPLSSTISLPILIYFAFTNAAPTEQAPRQRYSQPLVLKKAVRIYWLVDIGFLWKFFQAMDLGSQALARTSRPSQTKVGMERLGLE